MDPTKTAWTTGCFTLVFLELHRLSLSKPPMSTPTRSLAWRRALRSCDECALFSGSTDLARQTQTRLIYHHGGEEDASFRAQPFSRPLKLIQPKTFSGHLASPRESVCSSSAGTEDDLLPERPLSSCFITAAPRSSKGLPPQTFPKQHAAGGAAHAGRDNLSGRLFVTSWTFSSGTRLKSRPWPSQVEACEQLCTGSRTQSWRAAHVSRSVSAKICRVYDSYYKVKVKPERLGIFLAPDEINLCDHLRSKPRLAENSRSISKVQAPRCSPS